MSLSRSGSSAAWVGVCWWYTGTSPPKGDVPTPGASTAESGAEAPVGGQHARPDLVEGEGGGETGRGREPSRFQVTTLIPLLQGAAPLAGVLAVAPRVRERWPRWPRRPWRLRRAQPAPPSPPCSMAICWVVSWPVAGAAVAAAVKKTVGSDDLASLALGLNSSYGLCVAPLCSFLSTRHW